MALPSSGSISTAMINTELGRGTNDVFNFQTAAQGGYVTLNTNSPSLPSSSAPFSLQDWYSYDHSASPAAPSFTGNPSLVTYQEPDCGVSWMIQGFFVGIISNPDNTLYKVSVYDGLGIGLLMDDIGFTSPTPPFDTGEQGSLISPTRNVEATWMLRIIRRSDNTIIDWRVTNTLDKDMTAPC